MKENKRSIKYKIFATIFTPFIMTFWILSAIKDEVIIAVEALKETWRN